MKQLMYNDSVGVHEDMGIVCDRSCRPANAGDPGWDYYQTGPHQPPLEP